MRRIYVILMLVSAMVFARQMPVEKRLAAGVLPNHLSYYLMHNEKPKGMVEFRLLVRAGSLEENEDQRGLAHFVEHMAFNGTRHFRKNDLIGYLESIGMSFGGDLNANTNYTRTLYLLTVPNKKEDIDNALIILGDWANGISFDPSEFDKERGVILEEKRLRNNANYRMYKKYMPLFFRGSRYENRLTIGKEDILRNAPVSLAVDFYKKWYRPELMSLIVVGDINVTQVKSEIISRFGKLPNTNHAKPVSVLVPEHNTTRVMALTDKELTRNSADIYYVWRRHGSRTEADKKRDIIDLSTILMFNLNAQRELLNPQSKVLAMGMSDMKLAPLKHAFDFGVIFKNSERKAAFGQLAALMARFDKYGFSKTDLSTIKRELLSMNDNHHKEYRNITSATFAAHIEEGLETGDLFVDDEYDYNISKSIIEGMTVNDINERFRDILADRDRVILFRGTDPKSISKADALSIIQKSNAKVPAPVFRHDDNLSLLSVPLPDARIVSKHYDPRHSLYRYTLSNGIKVDFMPTKFRKNEVILSAYSKGGDSVLPIDMLNNAKKTSALVLASAPGKLSPSLFREKMAGKDVRYDFTIGRFYESIHARSSTQDMETLLKLIYLQANEPKIDPHVANNQKRNLLNAYAHADRDPAYRFVRALLPWYYKHNPRIFFDTNESIMALNPKKMLEIFRSKFGDMNHFHFTIVGDISPEKLEPIMAKYLGNLPSRKTDDEQYDNKPYDRLHGMQRFVRAYNTTNIANNTLEYRSKLPFSMKTMAELDAVKSILRVRLRKLIREKKSGTYGIGVDCTLTRELGDITQCDINFAADPSRTDELVELTRKVIDGFVSAGPSTEEMANYKAEFGVSNKLARKQNSYWKMVIESSNKYNTPLETYLQFPDTVDKLSAADVHEAAKVLFGGDLLVALRMPKKL